MNGTKIKKRLLSATATKPESKKRKTEQDDQKTNETDQFLSPVVAFILQAGIEKLRMQIFRTQLIKYGGCLKGQLSTDVTHIIVDDKMEADRMCRLLNADKPPDFAVIVKTGWLSKCFKDKKMIDTKPFLLNLTVFEAKPETNKQGDKASTSNNDTQNDSSKSDFPKVGMMFGHKAKLPQQPDDEADSDYVQSDVDSEDSALGPEVSSSSSTPSTSPKKAIPVSYNMVVAQLLRLKKN